MYLFIFYFCFVVRLWMPNIKNNICVASLQKGPHVAKIKK